MRTLAGFFFLLRGLSMKFAKPPTTFQEQVDLLKSRGLIINDPNKALQNISRINYYRLSSYYTPLLEEYNDVDIESMGFPVDWKDRINSI